MAGLTAYEAKKGGPPSSGPQNGPSSFETEVGQHKAHDQTDEENAQQHSSSWSANDDKTLMMARSRGQGWADIRKKHFPKRTPNACRKRWERLMENRATVEKDGHRTQRISEEYLAMRKAIWTPLAERMGESWQWVEAQCLSVGLKSIQSSARSHTHRHKRESRRAQQAYEAHLAGQGPGDGPLGGHGFGFTPASPEMTLPPAVPMLPSAYSSQPYPAMAGDPTLGPAVVFGGYLNGKTTGRALQRGQQSVSDPEQRRFAEGSVGRDVGHPGSAGLPGWDGVTYQDSARAANRTLH
ncbi:hypothetical protein QBC43DRAFT_337990 [Cladorrhinum sp. PSN259]|nr:hypothetical protein QBC43DRAFT_337990 [Cladorrhinum sp. PSN259]